MIGALLYLTVCSFRNRLRVRFRRLKEPRYLIATLLGGLYFYLIFFQRRMSTGRPPRVVAPVGLAGLMSGLELIIAVGLFLLVALAWLWPRSGRAVLGFSQAEVNTLFTAPISRRQLIGYRIARTQIGSLLSSAIMTLVFRPGSLATGWTFFVGFWLLSSTLSVHLMGVGLNRANVTEHGRSGLARVWLPMALVLAAIVVLVATIVANWTAIGAAPNFTAWAEQMRRMASTGAAGLVLWPFRAMARLPMSGTPIVFLRALPIVLVLLALNVVWVLRSDASFEEASAEAAEKIARVKRGERTAPAKPRVRSAPFELGLTGSVELAILWKNLILLGRYASLKTLFRLIPIVLVFIVMGRGLMRDSGGGDEGRWALFGLCQIFGAMLVLFGPSGLRSDLRSDLSKLSLLKAWPVRGASLLRGEVLAPTAVLTVFAWIVIVVGAAVAPSHWTMLSRSSYIVGAVCLAPGLILVQVVAQNGLAVLFPAWVPAAAPRAAGIEDMGQRMLTMIGMMLTLLLSLIPAGVVAGLAALAIYAVTRVVPIMIPAFVILVGLVIECAVATELLGAVLDRTDLTDVDAPR